MIRAQRFTRVIPLVALIGALLLIPVARVLAISYSVTFDSGGHSYTISLGVLDSIGNPGYGVRGVSPDQEPNKRYARVFVPVNCTSNTVSVAFQVKFDTGNQNDYLEAQLWLFSGTTQVGYHNFGYLMRTPNVWLNFSRDISPSPSSAVTEVRVLAGYWEPNPNYVYLDNISITCTEGEAAPEYDSDPAIGETIFLGSTEIDDELTVSDAITVSNVGTGTLTLSSFGWDGEHAAAFAVYAPEAPRDVTMQSRVDIGISCTPPEYGYVSATLTIYNNDADEGEASYTIACFGLVEGSGGWAYPIPILNRPPETLVGVAADPAHYALDAARANWNTPYRIGSLGSTLAVFSRSVGDWVHSMYPGTVTAIEALADLPGPRYSPLGQETGTAPCTFGNNHFDTLPIGWPSYQTTCKLDMTGQGSIFIEWTQGYRVSVELSSGRTLRYIVGRPLVAVGQEIGIGCALGHTLSFYTWGVVSPEYSAPFVSLAPGALAPYGYTLVQGIDTGGIPFNVAPMLQLEPVDVVCGAPSASDECTLLANPRFENLISGGWTPRFHPDYGGGGANPPGAGTGLDLSTAQGAFLSQDLHLDLAREYRILVSFHNMRPQDAQAGVHLLWVGFGNWEGTENEDYVEHQINVDPRTAGLQSVVVPAAAIDDYVLTGNISRFWIRAQPYTPVIVDFVCVQDSAEDPPLPSECILFDHEFDALGGVVSGQGWTTTGDAQIDFLNGIARIPHGDSISQSLTLHPRSGAIAQGYDIQIVARRGGIPAQGASISLDWDWDEFGSEGLGPLTNRTWQTLTDDFEVEESATATLTITADGSDGDQELELDRVCIVTTDGSRPPGYRPPPFVTPSCRACAFVATGDLPADFVEYVGWLNCKFFQLWECQFKTVLEAILRMISNVLTMLGYMRIWMAAVLLNLWTAINANIIVLARWLEGTITNALALLAGAGGGGGGSIWDVLAAFLNLLNSLVQGIFGLLGAFLEIVAALVGLIVNVLAFFMAQAVGIILSVIQALSNGINMAAAPDLPDWVPNCADPNSPLIGICGGLGMLEDELSSGPANYLIPGAFGVALVNLLLWGAETFLGIFRGTDEG